MLGECNNFSACHSCRFGLVNSQRLLWECFSSSVLFFYLGFLRLPFFSSFYLSSSSIILFCFVLFHFGGGEPISLFFFPLPSPPPSPLLPQSIFVFGSVSCFCALWVWFLGLSCSVVVLQTHCGLKASVPVPTTIQEGGRGPTAGMLGQKVTAQAHGYKGAAQTDGRRSEPGWGLWREQPNLADLTDQPPLTQSWRPSSTGPPCQQGASTVTFPSCLSTKPPLTLPKDPPKQAFEAHS